MAAARKLILLEDDPLIQEVVRKFVESAGWSVDAFDDGNKAAAAFGHTRYDAAIFDVQVPGMNGPTLLERVRKERPDFPVVLMSGQATEASVQALLGRRVRLLGKPFTSNELRAALDLLDEGIARESLSVLVVDDHDGIRAMVEGHLLAEGFRVESFPTGTEALARIARREKPYDIALVDLHLPGMLGMEVVRALGKASPKTLPIMMTGEANAQEIQEGYKNGAYGLLRKPFNLDELSRYFRQLDPAMRDRKAEGAKKEALASAPLPVQVLHDVKASWNKMSPGRRREAKSLFVVLILAVAIGVPILSLMYSAYEYATGGENQIVTWMDTVVGYLERDEERELRGQKGSHPQPPPPTPGGGGH